MSQHYPTLRLIERHGDWFSIAAASAPFLASIIAALLGASAWWLAAGAVAAIFLFIAARSYVEMIRLMTDMLLPK